jgi:hypothetical protein
VCVAVVVFILLGDFYECFCYCKSVVLFLLLGLVSLSGFSVYGVSCIVGLCLVDVFLLLRIVYQWWLLLLGS